MLSVFNVGLYAERSFAEVIADESSLGTQVDVTTNGYDISGGALSENGQNLFHDFNQFDIEQNQTATFLSPDSTQNIIGRIDSQHPSQIHGSIAVEGSEANIYLMNPAGIFIGSDAHINLPGSITATSATSLNFEEGDFSASTQSVLPLNGSPTGLAFDLPSPGAVINQGSIRAGDGSTVTLIGGSAASTGSVSTESGQIQVAAVEGNSWVRLGQENQLLSLEVRSETLTAAQANSPPPLGELLTGPSVESTDELSFQLGEDGQLVLAYSPHEGAALVSGDIDVSGEMGGNVSVLGENVQLAGATINAMGSTRGGTINIGGGARGQGTFITAKSTQVDAQSEISASALTSGNGGGVSVWAEGETAFWGQIAARGGAHLGDGGQVEVSGAETLTFGGGVDVRAIAGTSGSVLLDPQNLTITDGTAPSNTPSMDYVASSSVEGLTGHVVIEASDHIVVENLSDDALDFAFADSVTFKADTDGDGVGSFLMDASDRIVTQQAPLIITGAGLTLGTLSTSIDSTGNDGVPGGSILLSSTLDINAVNLHTYSDRPGSSHSGGAGGNITAFATGDIQIAQDVLAYSAVGNHTAGSGGSIFIETTAGDINIDGRLSSASSSANRGSGRAGDITLRAGPGTIQTGTIDASSTAGGNLSETGGNVVIEASDFSNSGGINTASIAGNNFSNSGGNVQIMADNVNIQASGPDAISTVSIANRSAQSGGNVSILANDSIDISGNIITFALARTGRDTGSGGELTLTGNTVQLDDIGTWTSADRWTHSSPGLGSAGDITITEASSQPGNTVSLGNIFATSYAQNRDARNGSSINISSDSIQISSIDTTSFASSTSADSGSISLNGRSHVNVSGQLRADSQATSGSVGNASDITVTGGQSIQIGAISANGSASSNNRIDVDTQGTLTLTGLVDGVRSISTSSAGADTISLKMGAVSQVNPSFQIGSVVTNGARGVIATGTHQINQLSVASGETATVGNITITNRGQLSALPSSVLPIEAETITTVTTISQDQASSAELAYMSGGPAEQLSTAEIFEQIELGISEIFAAQLGLATETKPASLYEIQSTLSDVRTQTAVEPGIIYAYYVPDAAQGIAVGAAGDRTPRADDQLEVMLISRNGEPVRRRVWGITRAAVEQTTHQLRAEISHSFSRSEDYLAPAQRLHRWIIEPLEETLAHQQIDSLGFVMDTGLRTLPIAALHNGEHYLIERFSLGLLPTFSLTDFAQAGHIFSRTDFSQSEVLAMGASEFENQPELPAVNAEVRLITEQLWEGDAFLNEAFVLDNFQAQLQEKDYGLVHLATHATFEGNSLKNSYIQLWDQRLSLAEIDQLNLSSADIRLIILSACNTALGDASSEYGFAGLAVHSGSQSALASLWPVSDEGTLGFMSQFYRALRQSSTRVEALQTAQRQMIEGEVGIRDGQVYGPQGLSIADLSSLQESGRWDFSHPFYWSAFTMIGNPW